MAITIQVTLFDKGGHYKPVSSLVKVESASYYNTHKADVQRSGIIKICQKRGWTKRELEKYGYTHCKMRLYENERGVK